MPSGGTPRSIPSWQPAGGFASSNEGVCVYTAPAGDDPARPSHSLKDKVAALLERAGPSTRAHFMGSADLHRPAVR